MDRKVFLEPEKKLVASELGPQRSGFRDNFFKALGFTWEVWDDSNTDTDENEFRKVDLLIHHHRSILRMNQRMMRERGNSCFDGSAFPRPRDHEDAHRSEVIGDSEVSWSRGSEVMR
jgi:hypothetical protein